ncbi:hypothetical protein C8R47DRAFT_131457 [Mycena vitilis]|nr:hypothetical protein C8R47DRAFT_131457 [Mycena vitilis]
MALQTKTESQSSNLTPSSAAAPPPTTTDSDPSDSGFSLSASPPLILAFLAVGMFAISMVVFFGWRRMTAGRRAWTTPSVVVLVGDIPKLWDVWSPVERPVAAEWHSIQPLAATVWDATSLPAPAVDDASRSHSTFAAAAVAHLHQRYRRRRPQEDVAMEAKMPSAASPVRLQVAVTIAMPSPDSASSSQRTEPDEERPLDYYSIASIARILSPLCQKLVKLGETAIS